MQDVNPVLKKLGFDKGDRVVIIHADDIGMCHSSVSAFQQLFEIGTITSGAVMVPCPWFLSAVELKNFFPEIDLGVHLTLTSEWKSYRWGPISTRDKESGLLDSQGYFFSETTSAQQFADPGYAAIELEEQIKQMMGEKLFPSHIDTHMGAVAHPKFMMSYIELGLKYRLPIMMFRMTEPEWRNIGLDEDSAKSISMVVNQLEEMQFPLIDHLVAMSLDDPDHRMEKAEEILRNLSPGITHFIIHPTIDSPEIRSITPDWRCRVGDFNLFKDEAILNFMQDLGIKRIGYRDLQKIIPTSMN